MASLVALDVELPVVVGVTEKVSTTLQPVERHGGIMHMTHPANTLQAEVKPRRRGHGALTGLRPAPG